MEVQEKKNKIGRPSNENEKTAIINCINKGLGYLRSVPELISAGFVDEDGNCTISERKFSYVRKNMGQTRRFSIDLSPELFAWADSHQSEIIAYIQARMSQDK